MYMNFLGLITKRKVSTKLLLLSLLYMFPIFSLTYHVVMAVKELNIDFAGKEKMGSAYIRPVSKLLNVVGTHRMRSVELSPAELADLQHSGDNAFGELKTAQSTYGEELGITDGQLQALATQWQEVKSAADGKWTEEKDAKQSELLDGLKAVWDKVGGTSNLVLDPDLDAYNLMDTLVGKVPLNQLRLTKIYPFVRNALAGDVLSQEQRTQLAIYASHLEESDLAFIKAEAETAIAEDKNVYGVYEEFQKDFPEKLAAYVAAAQSSIALLNELSKSEKVHLGREQVQSSLSDLWKASFALWDTGIKDLDGLLDIRIDHAQTQQFSDIAPSYAILLVAFLLVWVISRSITKPLDAVLTELRQSAGQVASASSQLAGSSQSLAQGATQQAASLEETAASLEEVSAMSKQSNDNAVQAAAITKSVEEVSNKGVESMKSVAKATDDIKLSADETAEIVRIIDSIAFQTNLLALNAAVEAARAGDAGKGFAVVAEEVRNLARRSAEAAKKTAEKIGRSKELAENGVKMVADVSAFLVQIHTSALKAAAIVGEISAAAKEQTTSIQQISLAVGELDKVTQINSASAEESSASSEELLAQARAMNSMINDLADVVHGSTSHAENVEEASVPSNPAFEKNEDLDDAASWAH